MTQKWKDIENIETVAELDFVWNDLSSDDRKEFQEDVLYFAHTQGHTHFMQWSKEKYNRYKYVDAKVHKNLIDWCKNWLYFTRFYMLRASIVIMTKQIEGKYLGSSIKKRT